MAFHDIGSETYADASAQAKEDAEVALETGSADDLKERCSKWQKQLDKWQPRVDGVRDIILEAGRQARELHFSWLPSAEELPGIAAAFADRILRESPSLLMRWVFIDSVSPDAQDDLIREVEKSCPRFRKGQKDDNGEKRKNDEALDAYALRALLHTLGPESLPMGPNQRELADNLLKEFEEVRISGDPKKRDRWRQERASEATGSFSANTLLATAARYRGFRGVTLPEVTRNTLAAEKNARAKMAGAFMEDLQRRPHLSRHLQFFSQLSHDAQDDFMIRLLELGLGPPEEEATAYLDRVAQLLPIPDDDS